MFTCPQCGGELSGDEHDPFLLRCRACDQSFEHPQEDVELATQELAPAIDDDERLNSMRIRALAADKRAAMRVRSYWWILIVAAVVMLAQIIWMATR